MPLRGPAGAVPAEAATDPIPVVGAVIERDGRVLCARRGSGEFAGSWEFPGGKVEPGEDPRAALAREISEELGCRIAVGAPITTTVHAAAHATISLTTYHGTIESGEPEPIEHAELRWLTPSRLAELPWAPADLATVALLHT